MSAPTANQIARALDAIATEVCHRTQQRAK